MKCILMNQNTEIMTLEYDEKSKDIFTNIYEVNNIDYAPLSVYNASMNKSKSLVKETSKWFRGRGIPAWRKDLDKLLQNLGIQDSDELLNKAYGLSLSDQYWIKPYNSKIEWKDINFFDHNFEGEVFLTISLSPRSDIKTTNKTFSSPNNTTNGMLPKAWIVENGKRVLVKSTYEFSNQEPFNEWLASEICNRLGFDHCVYKVDIYKDRLVSKCNNFLTKDEEIITASDIFDLKKKSNNISEMDHYLNILEEYGIENAREQFENMLIVDFLTMNTDRHMKNYGVIRNVKTLKWERLTPIFDTGQSMNCDKYTPQMNFSNGEGKLFSNTNKPFSTYLDLIEDITRIDISKLDDIVVDYKDKLFEYKDIIGFDEDRINKLVNGLNTRINLLELEIDNVIEYESKGNYDTDSSSGKSNDDYEIN